MRPPPLRVFEEYEIYAAADALRRYETVGRKVAPWNKLHRTSRKRWLTKVHVVLDALNAADTVIIAKVDELARATGGAS